MGPRRRTQEASRAPLAVVARREAVRWSPKRGWGTDETSLQLLLDSFVAIAAERDLDATLERAVDLARLSTRSHYGVGLGLDDRGAIVLPVIQGLTDDQLAALPDHVREGGIVEAVLERKEPLRIVDLGDDDRLSAVERATVPVGAFLGVPVLAGGRAIAAIILARLPGEAPYDERDELFVEAIARQTAVALDKAALLAELRSVNGELRVADQLKSDFVSMASHELRTPLTSIVGFASTLLSYWDETPEGDKRSYIGVIDRQAQRLARLVNDLLAMSRIESGSLHTRRAVVDVRVAIAQALADLGTVADDVVVRCDDGLTALAVADHVQQILVNYLSNAFKYGAAPVEVDAARDGHRVVLHVRDHGTGVPESFVDQLFDKFAQASTGSTRRATGTGLGLSIVRGLARANGGDAWYEPAAPGSVFSVWFEPPEVR